jgi:hypothetical protein
MRRQGHPAAFLMSVALLLGCEGDRRPAPMNRLTIDKLPPAALKAAKAKLPDVAFEEAWKVDEGGREAFEVRGTNPRGKTRDIRVTADGKILEID